MPFGKLSRKDTEMIIIRVAHLRSCDYEMDHHRKLGKRAGLDNAAIGRIIEGPDAGWGDRERSLLLAVDEIVGSHDVTDETWAGLTRHLDEPEQIRSSNSSPTTTRWPPRWASCASSATCKEASSVPSLAQHLMANPVVSAVYEGLWRPTFTRIFSLGGPGTAEYDKAFTAYLARTGERLDRRRVRSGLYTRRLAQHLTGDGRAIGLDFSRRCSPEPSISPRPDDLHPRRRPPSTVP